MGGQVIDCGRTELVLVIAIILLSKDRGSSETCVGKTDCSCWVGWRNFRRDRNCTVLFLQRESRISRRFNFTAVVLFIPFLAPLTKLAQCLQAFWVLFKNQTVLGGFDILTRLSSPFHRVARLERSGCNLFWMECSGSRRLIRLIIWARYFL